MLVSEVLVAELEACASGTEGMMGGSLALSGSKHVAGHAVEQSDQRRCRHRYPVADGAAAAAPSRRGSMFPLPQLCLLGLHAPIYSF